LLPRERLREEAGRLLERFLGEMMALRPKCVLLFGSYARGDFTESSDIDVCVVAEGLPEDAFERRYPKGFYSAPRIRAIGFHPGEFLDYIRNLRLLAHEILSEGKVLYDDGFYGEAMKAYRECLDEHGLIKEGRVWRLSGCRPRAP
jgi:predicted nucleotidyltransferase